MGPGSLALFLLLIFAGNFAHASGYQGGGGGGGGGGDPSSTNEINTFTVDVGSPTTGLIVDLQNGGGVGTLLTVPDRVEFFFDDATAVYPTVGSCIDPDDRLVIDSFNQMQCDSGGMVIPNLLDDLSDVIITSPATGAVLKYNGTNWIDDTDLTGGGGGALDDLTDVSTATAASGDFLQFNGTNWVDVLLTDADVPNSITVTTAGSAVVAMTGDSATGFFGTGELEATLMPAVASDCTASRWAKGIDADFVLDCSQPAFTDISGSATDAQIPDTLTLTDITQIGTRPHASLTGLTADDHTQYALLAGRTGAGGQILYGGTASGELLVLESTSNPTKGTIYFGLATEWEWSDGIVDPVDSSVAVGGKWDPTISVTGIAGGTSIVRGLSIAPTYNYDDASGVIINTYTGVEGGGTFTVSGAGTQASSWSLFNATALLTATAAAKVPPTPAVFRSGITVDYSATSGTGTMSLSKPFEDNTIYRNTDAGGIFAITAPSSFVANPIFTETAGQLNITSFRGFFAMDPAINGTPQITNQFGVDVQRPTRGSTPATTVGVRNAGSEAYPPITQALADEFTITPSATIVQVTATTDPIDSGATAITDGADGQLLYIVNIDETAAQTITFADDSNTQLSAATIDLDRCDSITLLFMASIGDWIQVGNVNALC